MSTAALRRRLSQLELSVQEIQARQCAPQDGDREFLKGLEELGKEGFFDHEPDFPRALENYRQALDTASLQPSDYLSTEVKEACLWLCDMYQRTESGIPPVTETEFYELKAWFEANDARLRQRSLPSQLLELGENRRTSTSDIRFGLWTGPRAVGAGRLAEDLRQLKRLYG